MHGRRENIRGGKRRRMHARAAWEREEEEEAFACQMGTMGRVYT